MTPPPRHSNSSHLWAEGLEPKSEAPFFAETLPITMAEWENAAREWRKISRPDRQSFMYPDHNVDTNGCHPNSNHANGNRRHPNDEVVLYGRQSSSIHFRTRIEPTLREAR